jgi:hypothetical protein
MKPFIHNRDLLILLPVMLGGYAFLYIAAVAFGSGPIPPMHLFTDNLALLFWSWLALFVVNTALYRVQVRQERRERAARQARLAALRAARANR